LYTPRSYAPCYDEGRAEALPSQFEPVVAAQAAATRELAGMMTLNVDDLPFLIL